MQLLLDWMRMDWISMDSDRMIFLHQVISLMYKKQMNI